MPEGESPTGRQSTAGTSRHPNCPAHRQQQHARRLSAAVRTAADCRQTRAARSTLQLSVPLDRAQRSQIPPWAPTTTAMRHATSAKGPGRPAGGRAARTARCRSSRATRRQRPGQVYSIEALSVSEAAAHPGSADRPPAGAEGRAAIAADSAHSRLQRAAAGRAAAPTLPGAPGRLESICGWTPEIGPR